MGGEVVYGMPQISRTPAIGGMMKLLAGKARRQFTREFKLEAVQLVREYSISITQAARGLDLHEKMLRKRVWLYESDPAPYISRPGEAGTGGGRLRSNVRSRN